MLMFGDVGGSVKWFGLVYGSVQHLNRTKGNGENRICGEAGPGGLVYFQNRTKPNHIELLAI